MRYFFVIQFIGFVCLFVAHEAAAQAGAGRETSGSKAYETAGETELKIKRLSGLGARNRVKTPTYNTNVAKGTKPAREWAEIRVIYDTKPEWIDELTFQYYALALKLDEGKNLYSLFKTTVSYVDIERGRDHISAVYLRPTAVKRHGELVAVAVEISYGGKVVAEETETDPAAKLPPKRWWRDPKVVESKLVAVRDGYLVEASESPFAFINMDDYEMVK